MKYKTQNSTVIKGDGQEFCPSLSVDCVILGFHEGTLKILLNKFKNHTKWMLPGGFVFKTENVDAAAYRVLKHRTGLDNIYLRQFHLFGDYDRTKIDENEQMMKENNVEADAQHWFLQRFVSVGYYALVEYSKVHITTDADSEDIAWFHFDEIPQLYSDHNKIIDKALATIRQQIDYIPFGFELLPDKFALSELRIIYETLIGKQLDRRNFQRKILSLGLINKLDEVRKKWGYRSATLYEFDKEKYDEALDKGTSLINW
jgi:8-oxo-dGTP diphosphatase